MPKTSDVGVIVGRFQVHQLHAAHRSLIQSVYETHPRTLIVLGLSPARGTARNPLDFEARKQMLLEAFPKATVLYLKDERDDDAWSRKLDELVNDMAPGPGSPSIKMFGGRDSFISHYTGRFPTEILEPEVYASGTEMRRTISRSVKASEDFRAGVIWAAANGYSRVFPTVDVAIYRSGAMHSESTGVMPITEVLLVRKPSEKFWRFCGGFVDPKDANFEAAARREVQEEVGAEVGALHYICSHRVDDWRYRHEDDKIVTTFYAAPLVFGPIRPADDVSEARWFGSDVVERILVERSGDNAIVVPEHWPLVKALQVTLENGGLK